ncbi:hypothetical protein F4818DRAFT_396966 [Hypoxylon cercidicola]|nr:hypothetical protein F4818DRAFT_396966 [Hypoxylon cercidicola]
MRPSDLTDCLDSICVKSKMATLHHSIVFLHFQHDLQLKTSPQLNTVLKRVSQIKGWDYTCFGKVLSHWEKVLVIIGWQDNGGTQTQTQDFWSTLGAQLATEPTIINLLISLQWSTLITPYLIELNFLRGSPELVRPEQWIENVAVLCQRTVPSPDHEPPDALVGCQGGVARNGDQDSETTVVLLWRWTSTEARQTFVDPLQESLGGSTQYADLVGKPLKAATEAGAQLEKVDVKFERWRPKQNSQHEKTSYLVQ